MNSLSSSVILYDFQHNCPEQMFQVDGVAVMYGKGRLYAVIANVLWIRITISYLLPTAALCISILGEAWGRFCMLHCTWSGYCKNFGGKKSTIWMINSSFIEHFLIIDFFFCPICEGFILHLYLVPCNQQLCSRKVLPWASDCAIDYHTGLVLEILILLWES